MCIDITYVVVLAVDRVYGAEDVSVDFVLCLHHYEDSRSELGSSSLCRKIFFLSISLFPGPGF